MTRTNKLLLMDTELTDMDKDEIKKYDHGIPYYYDNRNKGDGSEAVETSAYYKTTRFFSIMAQRFKEAQAFEESSILKYFIMSFIIFAVICYGLDHFNILKFNDVICIYLITAAVYSAISSYFGTNLMYGRKQRKYLKILRALFLLHMPGKFEQEKWTVEELNHIIAENLDDIINGTYHYEKKFYLYPEYYDYSSGYDNTKYLNELKKRTAAGETTYKYYKI